MNAVIVLDESQSMGAERPAAGWSVAADVLAGLPPGSQYSLIRFGAEAVLEVADRPTAELAERASRPRRAVLDATGTNIEAALRLAGRHVDGETPALLVLITDGGETAGDATTLLERASSMAFPLPYLLLTGADASGPDAAIEAPEVPSRVRLGTVISVLLNVTSNRDGAAEIRVRQAAQLVAASAVDLVRDQVSQVRVALAFDTPGPQDLEISVAMPGDVNPANDRRRSVVNVEGPTSILYVTIEETTAAAQSLLSGGWNVSMVRPEHFPQLLPRLQNPATVILDDVAIGDMPDPAWLALTESVRTNGTGLLVLGGQRSFGARGLSKLDAGNGAAGNGRSRSSHVARCRFVRRRQVWKYGARPTGRHTVPLRKSCSVGYQPASR